MQGYKKRSICTQGMSNKRENVFGLNVLIVPNVDGKSDFYEAFSFIYGSCDLQNHWRINRREIFLVERRIH